MTSIFFLFVRVVSLRNGRVTFALNFRMADMNAAAFRGREVATAVQQGALNDLLGVVDVGLGRTADGVPAGLFWQRGQRGAEPEVEHLRVHVVSPAMVRHLEAPHAGKRMSAGLDEVCGLRQRFATGVAGEKNTLAAKE